LGLNYIKGAIKMLIAAWFIINLFLLIAAVKIAHNKGFSAFGAVVLTFFLGIIAIIFLAVIPANKERLAQRLENKVDGETLEKISRQQHRNGF
jgi:formate hydrogenlyase subunit 4